MRNLRRLSMQAARQCSTVAAALLCLFPGAGAAGADVNDGNANVAPAAVPSAQAARPASWAHAVPLEGFGNLYRVTDRLYRSEQPTPPGMRQLEALGIRTIINLRNFHSDRARVNGTSLRLFEMNINTWDVQADDVVRVLQLVREQSRSGAVLIHCQHGADRTGLMIAMFRVIEQGWSRDDAIAEMTGGGYGFHPLWRHIPAFVRKVDVDALRHAVDGGVAPSVQP